MAWMELPEAAIEEGLPRCCVYCGEFTEDSQDFRVLAFDKRIIPLPFCDEHLLIRILPRCLLPFNLVLVGGYILSMFLQGALVAVLIVNVWWLIASFLSYYWIPYVTEGETKKQPLRLHNPHRQFRAALDDRRL
ncbi:MAG: hypothetical protein ACRC8S_07740 [Fimbriiglobus sp.]